MEDTAIIAAEKPQNGLAGLKHWRHDLLAGLVVSMVSVPFSLGIAVASGAPHLWTDLGDHRRIGIAVPGWFLCDHQRTGGRPGAGTARGDAAAGKRRPGDRLPLTAGGHLLDGSRAACAGLFQSCPLQRDLPFLGRRGDACFDWPLDHRQAASPHARTFLSRPRILGHRGRDTVRVIEYGAEGVRAGDLFPGSHFRARLTQKMFVLASSRQNG